MFSYNSNLNPETQRKIGAFIGAIVADAASLHLEWIYDQNKVNKIVSAEEKDPAFWEENHCPFFSLPNGKVSCYADQAIQALNVMFENGGSLDESKLIDHFLKYFGDPGSPYQVALTKRRSNKYPVEGNFFFDITNSTLMSVCHGCVCICPFVALQRLIILVDDASKMCCYI